MFQFADASLLPLASEQIGSSRSAQSSLLTAGTGRFNLARGAVGFRATLAASFSTTASGFISQEIGRSAGFLSMGAVAAGGTLLVWSMPAESKPERYEE